MPLKKVIILVGLFCVLSSVLLTACTSHKHVGEDIWYADTESHWQACSCGLSLNHEPHNLEQERCTICGHGVVHLETGSVLFTTYDVYGNCTLFCQYAADGSVEHEERTEYTYDAAGNILTQASYTNGVLQSEQEYDICEEGHHFLIKTISHHEDGTKTIEEYNEQQQIIFKAFYLANGKEESAYRCRYDEDDNRFTEFEYSFSRLHTQRSYTINEDLTHTLCSEVFYDTNGVYISYEYNTYGELTKELHGNYQGKVTYNRSYEHSYNEYGEKIMMRTYDFDELIEEVEYHHLADESGHWSTIGRTTVYYADGGKTITDRDPYGTWYLEITYDADGVIIERLHYEYELNEVGETIATRGYQNGMLLEETYTLTDEQGNTTGYIRMEYGADGTQTTYEYNEAMELIRTTTGDGTEDESP